MPDPGDTPAFTADLCLGCGYRRRGLVADAACPECGASPPSPECTALRGWSGTSPPWIAIGVGALALGFLLFQLGLVAAWAVGVKTSLRANGGFTYAVIIGLLFGVRGLRRWRLRERGGDVVWLAGPDGLEIREGDKTIVLTRAQLGRHRLRRWPRRGFTAMSLAPRSLWTANSARTLYATGGDPAIDRMQAALLASEVEFRRRF